MHTFKRACAKTHPSVDHSKISDSLWHHFLFELCEGYRHSPNQRTKTLVSCVGMQPLSSVWVLGPKIQLRADGTPIPQHQHPYYWYWLKVYMYNYISIYIYQLFHTVVLYLFLAGFRITILFQVSVEDYHPFLSCFLLAWSHCASSLLLQRRALETTLSAPISLLLVVFLLSTMTHW